MESKNIINTNRNENTHISVWNRRILCVLTVLTFVFLNIQVSGAWTQIYNVNPAYNTFSQTMENMSNLSATNPNFTSIDLGANGNGTHLKGLVVNQSTWYETILLTEGIHGNENVPTLYNFANYLNETPYAYTGVRYVILPIVNAEGWNKSQRPNYNNSGNSTIDVKNTSMFGDGVYETHNIIAGYTGVDDIENIQYMNFTEAGSINGIYVVFNALGGTFFDSHLSMLVFKTDNRTDGAGNKNGVVDNDITAPKIKKWVHDIPTSTLVDGDRLYINFTDIDIDPTYWYGFYFFYDTNNDYTDHEIPGGVGNIAFYTDIDSLPTIKLMRYTTTGGWGNVSRVLKMNVTHNVSKQVDINRNFVTGWGTLISGGSKDPTSIFYIGDSPASENETKMLQNLVNTYNFSRTIDIHSNLNRVICNNIGECDFSLIANQTVKDNGFVAFVYQGNNYISQGMIHNYFNVYTHDYFGSYTLEHDGALHPLTTELSENVNRFISVLKSDIEHRKVIMAQNISIISSYNLSMTNFTYTSPIINMDVNSTGSNIINLTNYGYIFQNTNNSINTNSTQFVNISNGKQQHISSVNLKATPTADYIIVNVTAWNTSGTYYRALTVYSNTHINPTTFVIGGFPTNTYIRVNKNGVFDAYYLSNSAGYITVTHSSYSDVVIEAFLAPSALEAATCPSVNSDINVVFGLIGVLLIVFAAVLVIQGVLTMNSTALIGGIGAGITGAIMILIGYFITSTVGNGVGCLG